jgi:hypothetical protein
LIAAYLGVSLLHALWDSMPTIAAVITLLLTGSPWQYELMLHGWIVAPTATQVELYTTLSWAGLAVLGGIGVLWLRAEIRRADRPSPEVPPTFAYRLATSRDTGAG